MLLEILHQFSKQNDKSIHYIYIYTLPAHVTYKSWIASTFLSNILYCYISIAAILAINFVHSAIGVMPSRYIETWEDADGTKFELLGLMTHLHFYMRHTVTFNCLGLRRVWVSGYWRAISAWSHVRPIYTHVMSNGFISLHRSVAYIASNSNVKPAAGSGIFV